MYFAMALNLHFCNFYPISISIARNSSWGLQCRAIALLFNHLKSVPKLASASCWCNAQVLSRVLQTFLGVPQLKGLKWVDSWFKQFLFVHTVQLCNKHIYYNHKIFHKKPPGKTSFFVAEEKSTEGQRKNTPTAAPCGLAPTQSSPPGRRSIIASTPCPYSNCLSTTLAIRAQGLHIRFWW